MKRILTVAAVMLCTASNFAQQVTSLAEIVSFMSTNDYRRCFIMTNVLDLKIMSATGIVERSTYKLLKASILFDHSENAASSTSFDSATNLCGEIESDLSGLLVWQRIGALCKFTNAMIEDEHPEVSFVVSTNLLDVFQPNQNLGVDTNVWNVLFKSGGLELMQPYYFIKANAAASRFRMDPNADISLYTNGLPEEIHHEIIR